MSSVTAVYVVYLAATVILVVGFTGRTVMGLVSRLLLRREKLRQQRRLYQQRRRMVIGERAHRAFEDPCWRMFREQEAEHARAFPEIRRERIVADARELCRLAVEADNAARDERGTGRLLTDLGGGRPVLVAVPDPTIREAV